MKGVSGHQGGIRETVFFAFIYTGRRQSRGWQKIGIGKSGTSICLSGRRGNIGRSVSHIFMENVSLVETDIRSTERFEAGGTFHFGRKTRLRERYKKQEDIPVIGMHNYLTVACQSVQSTRAKQIGVGLTLINAWSDARMNIVRCFAS